MIRTTNRRLATVVALTALVGAALVTTGFVGGAAAASNSDGTITTGDSDPISTPDVEVNVTQTYHWDPADSGNVTVEYVVTNPEVTDRSDVSNVRLNLSRVDYDPTSTDGLEHVGGDIYRITANGGNASVTFRDPIGGMAGETYEDSYARFFPTSIRDCGADKGGAIDNGCSALHGVIVEADTSDSTTVGPTYTYATDGHGLVTSGNSEYVSHIDENNVGDVQYYPMIVVGQFQTYAPSDGSDDVRFVVPNGLETRESPQVTVDAVAESVSHLDAGHRTGTRYLVAKTPNPDGGGWTLPDGAHWALIDADLPVHTATKVPVHEFVHTTDDMNRSTDGEDRLNWMAEPYASYRQMELSLQSGYGSYNRYRTVMQHARTTGVEHHYHDRYHSGALLLATLDRKIQRASNGENDLDDFVHELRTHDGEATEDDAFQIIKRIGDYSTAIWFDDVTHNPDHHYDSVKFTPDSAPKPLSLDDYQTMHGPVANVTSEVTNVAVDSPHRNRTVETDEFVTARERTTVEYTIEVQNDGDATGRYELRMRSSDADPFDSSPTVYDRASGTVASGETKTVTLRETIPANESRHYEAGRIVPVDVVSTNGSPSTVEDDGSTTERNRSTARTNLVNTVPPNTTIVRQNGSADTITMGAPITADTEKIALVANRTIDYSLYFPGNNTHLGSRPESPSYFTGSDAIKVVDAPEYQRGRNVEVAFKAESGNHSVQYISSLVPVNGTAVPTDPDGDQEYEDLNGDGHLSYEDVSKLHNNLDESSVQENVPAYDFDDDGDVDEDDVGALYDER